MPTPKRCSTAVPDEKPNANNSGFAAHGISIPWANPWNAPKNATAIIIIIVGNFFSIATDKPKKITEKIIPHSIISEKVKSYKKNLENNVIESSKDLKRKS